MGRSIRREKDRKTDLLYAAEFTRDSFKLLDRRRSERNNYVPLVFTRNSFKLLDRRRWETNNYVPLVVRTFLAGFCWVERCRAPNSVSLGESVGLRGVWVTMSGRRVRHRADRTFSSSSWSWMLGHYIILAASFWLARRRKLSENRTKLRILFAARSLSFLKEPDIAHRCCAHMEISVVDNLE